MGAAWREVKDGPAFERVLTMVRGREGARAGGVRHARDADRGAGGAPQGGRARRLQPQPRHQPRELPVDHHDPHLRRPACARCATCARRASRSAPAASSAWARASTTAARCCARWRTSIRSRRACRSTRSSACAGTPLEHLPPVDPLDLVRMIAVRAHPHAAGARASQRGADRAHARGAAAGHVRRARTRSSTATGC